MSVGRILVVDDDPQIRRVLRTTLIAQGYEVDDSRSGEEALDCIRSEKFDLLILDMNMPGMSGIEVCRSIRSTSDVAIIMLTVRDSESDNVAALDAEADDYVTKPFSSPELLARLRAALRRLPLSAGSGPQCVTFDEIEINFTTRRATVQTREVRLTPKEQDLLQYMLAHPNIPLSHTKLLQAVRGPDYGDEVEYLRVFINQLRKKIEPNPSKPKYLLTEPWVGYRFQLPSD
ncbi:MAG: response regulator transcription factor [Verrucomicrobia bacterium]|nr:response regulator transcription factor [Verrucomicrobiota bacterium]